MQGLDKDNTWDTQDGVHQYYSQPLRFNTGNPEVSFITIVIVEEKDNDDRCIGFVVNDNDFR